MNEAQIPFALHVATGRLVEVNDVPAGLKCGCICPGCNTPLVGRRCVERIDHFAHKTRNTYQETKRECNYSFLVSVRAMCKQILSESILDFELPAYQLNSKQELWLTTQASPLTGQKEQLTLPPLQVEVPARSIPLTPADIQVECEFNGVLVDCVTVDRKLVIYFTYDGRPIPENLFTATGADIVVINLHLIEPILRTKDKTQTIRSRLTELIYKGIGDDHSPFIKHRLDDHSLGQVFRKMLNGEDDARVINSERFLKWKNEQAYKKLISVPDAESISLQLQRLVDETKQQKEQSWFIEHLEFARRKEEQRLEKEAEKEREAQFWQEMRQREQARRHRTETRPLKQNDPTFVVAKSKLSMQDAILFIKKHGTIPASIDSITEEVAITQPDGWVVVEKDKIWFISPVETRNWKEANVRYSAGMRKGVWVARTEELELAFNIQQPFISE